MKQKSKKKPEKKKFTTVSIPPRGRQKLTEKKRLNITIVALQKQFALNLFTKAVKWQEYGMFNITDMFIFL